MPRDGRQKRPLVACEIAADRVMAARANATHDTVELATVRMIGADVVRPGLAPGNIANTGALHGAISSALETVGTRGRDIIAVVPDAAVRIALLDFDTLPDKAEDALAVVRFRLRKSLPFDLERATVSYQAFRSNGSGLRVVAAVMQNDVLAEYESAFRSAGYEPGVVLPSVLALLGVVDAATATLIVKSEPGLTTLAIVDRDELRLVRSIEGSGEPGPSDIAEMILPSIAFYEDNYNAKVETVLLCGLTHMRHSLNELREQSGAVVEEVPVSRYLGDAGATGENKSRLAGVVGALLG